MGRVIVVMREWMAGEDEKEVSGKMTFPPPEFHQCLEENPAPCLWESSGDRKEEPELSYITVTCLQHAVNQLALSKLFLFSEARVVFYQFKTWVPRAHV